MFLRSRALTSSLYKVSFTFGLQRKIHIQSESFLDGLAVFYHLNNKPEDYQLQNGTVSDVYKENAWLQIKSLLKSNRIYQFLHNTEVIKTNDTVGHTVIAGHVSAFVTDSKAAIVPGSALCMRDSSYVVGNDGKVQTIKGEWYDVPTRQLIYKAKYIDFETEVKSYFLGYDLQVRKLIEMNAEEHKRQEVLQRTPLHIAEAEKSNQEYIQFSGKIEKTTDSESNLSTHMMLKVFQIANVIEVAKENEEVSDMLQDFFGDSLNEIKRNKYFANTRFFSQTAAKSFFEFWETLSEDNKRTIAINQSEPLCAEIVFYQGRAYKGLGDLVTAKQRFQKTLAMDDQYQTKVENEISEIDNLASRASRNI